MRRRVLSLTMAREVLLFGLSANPPTGMQGHMGVVKYCRDAYDEVWLLPVYQHIYSSKRQLAPFEHRVEMCRLALEELEREDESGAALRVANEEREMFEQAAAASEDPEKLRLGSIDLVHFLLDKYRDTSFTMLLGGDTFADLLAGKWKRGDELMQLVKLLVVDRKGVDSPWRAQQNQSDRVKYLRVPELSDVSSTMVRSSADRNELQKHVHPAVLQYMEQHKLYAFASTE
jgi:nicotinate (nicotinamide) nucleotide adenylyltransferase